MNVLVVDDQYDVVQGVLTGIDWSSLYVSNVYHAYSAHEARIVLSEKDIHIMLCDIEMPVENGLELYNWARKENAGLQCIFLSAHSEFEYAKQAIQLGSFDYIVQPASYEDIQASIERAIQKIHENTEFKQLVEFGAYWRQNEDLLLENDIRSFLLDSSRTYEQLIAGLSNLDIHLTPQTRFVLVLIQLTKPSNEAGKEQLKQEVVQLVEPYELNVLFVQLDSTNYIAILHMEKAAADISYEGLFKQFVTKVQQKHSCFIACYVSEIGQADTLKHHYEQLCQMRKHNVALYSKVFMMKQSPSAFKEASYSIPNMHNWATLIAHGSSKTVRDEIEAYLEQQKQQGTITAEFLARFHQDFIQVFLTAAKQLKLDTSEIFFSRYPYEAYIRSYTSLDTMLDLVHFVLDYVEEQTMNSRRMHDPIESAVLYIDQNIEKNFSRSEIAEAIYINPEYLSRLFKRVKGISLNDYITMKKMEIAKSLLASTTIPIHLIASKVGYSNFSYFSQVFKKCYGIAPLEYRQRAQE